MPFTYRDRPKLSDRFRGKSGEEILNEMKFDLDNDTRMFFDSPWRDRRSNSGFSRGFPFDDRPSRTNVRSYLNDLASRHPEFADQLKEPPWSEDFVNPNFVGNRKQSNKSSEAQESDCGSSLSENPPGRNQNLNHFGLRNTVPLGQSISSSEDRRQRSMSAPPGSRTSTKPQRFISKCEIPIMQGPEEQGKKPAGSRDGSEQLQSKPGNTPNVRMIPIKVEGRDEPIVNSSLNIDGAAKFGGEVFQTPFEGRLPRDFGSYQKHSPRFTHRERAPPPQSQPQQKPQCPSQPETMPVSSPIPMPMQQPQPQQTPPPCSKDEVDSKQPEPPKVDPSKDPLTKVGLIQKEVDELKCKVEAFDGKSRSDKQFMMLDELLTRKLISLDDIDTEGKEDVRQARKDTIRSIQRCISLLESRVPTLDNNDNSTVSEDSTALVPVGCMEVDTIKENNVDNINNEAGSTEVNQSAQENKGEGSGEVV